MECASFLILRGKWEIASGPKIEELLMLCKLLQWRNCIICILSCRGRDIVVFVWSMIDLESFRNLGHHIDTIENICDAHNPYPPAIILCANKCDDCTSNTEFNLCKEQHSYPLIKTSKNGIGECSLIHYLFKCRIV